MSVLYLMTIVYIINT